MSHNGCHRLPGFAHFESSFNNSLCTFEQLDIRFATEDVGLPPPYPGTNTGLDLSSVNGLDLTSPNYEGLNLTQQCLNLSNSNRVNSSQTNQQGVMNKEGQGTVGQNLQQPQHFPSQSEMVLNLSTQIGLNLTRPGQTVMGYHPAMLDQGMGGLAPATHNGFNDGTVQDNSNTFDYYGNYYETGFHHTAATSTLGQMEEQRCSPLNLERRSSPLNLTAVGSVQRKRKPTPGQAVPLNMGKMNSMMAQQTNYQQNIGQDYTCNNHVYDYRIPNKMTAFYNQQQGSTTIPSIQNPQPQPIAHMPNHGSMETGKAKTQNKLNQNVGPGKNLQALGIVDKKIQSQSSNNLKAHASIGKTVPQNNVYQDYMKQQNINLSLNLSQSVNPDIFFDTLDFQEENLNGMELVNNNFVTPHQVQHAHLSNVGKTFSRTSRKSDGKDIMQNIKSQTTKKSQQTEQNFQNVMQSGKNLNATQLSLIPNQFTNSQQNNFAYTDSYGELGYSYTDALNFAAEDINAQVPTQAVSTDIKDAKSKHESEKEVILGHQTNVPASEPSAKKIRLLCSSCSLEFVSSAELNKHMNNHNLELIKTKYNCSLCKLGFIEESQLLSHNKLTHEVPKLKPIDLQDNKKECEGAKQAMNMTMEKICEKPKAKESIKYDSKNLGTEDIQKLKDELAREPFPYQCVTCSKKFAEKVELIQHIADHNEMKPFKCDVCNLGFTYMSAKKRHEKIHTQEKPFQCKECLKAFFRKSDMTQHQKTHSKIKIRHSCEACSQMFVSEAQLRDHKCSAKQPPSKQLKCDICPSILATKVEWGVHMWRHTKDSSYILTSESDPLPKMQVQKRLPSVNNCDNNVWKESGSLKPLNMQVVQS